MKLPTRQNKPLIGKSTNVAVISRAFVQIRNFTRLMLVTLLSLAALSTPQTAWAVPVTHVFTATTDLSFFGGDGTDEFRITYSFDTDLVGEVLTAGSSIYRPITGNVRADSVTGGFNLDFDASNLFSSSLRVDDNASVFPLPDLADVFSITFATTSSFSFGGEQLTGFALSLVDEQATVFTSSALQSGTAFFADVDAINLRFLYPIQLDPLTGLPVTVSSSGPGFLVVPRDGVSLVSVASVPVPAVLPLLAAGLAVMGLIGWRRGQRATVEA